MSDEITISKERWKQHRKYVRRLRKKCRKKSLALKDAQDELRALDYTHRTMGRLVSYLTANDFTTTHH